MGLHRGRIAYLDLSSDTVDFIEPSASMYARFLGGRGLGTAILYRHGLGAEPLSDESLCCIFTGALTGADIPFANRLSVIFRSPATRTIACVNTGGYVAVALKNAGFDGLVLRGRAPRPCYLLVHDGCIEVHDASQLWGKGTFDTTAALLAAHPKSRVVCIGPAGERQSPIATLINDKGRASGVRHGAGAVLGSKHVKAIVVSDDQRSQMVPRDEKKAKSVRVALHAAIRSSPVLNPKTGTMSVHGTGIAVNALGKSESLPVRNYRYTTVEGFEKVGGLAMTERVLVQRMTCSGCPVRCRRETGSTGERPFKSEGPDYAQQASLGSNCNVLDIEAVSYMNAICYDLGIDPVEMGNTLAMLAEASERGLVPGGLAWGDAARMIDLIFDTGADRELGQLLRLGASAAARSLGAPELAMSAKGISIQNCDPRPEPAWGLLNATEASGSAAHIWSFADLVEGLELVSVQPKVRRDSDAAHIAAMVKYKQDQVAMLDSLSMCTFSAFAFRDQDFADALALYSADAPSGDELLQKGAAIVDLERRFNEACGFGRADDTLARRFLVEPVPTGIHQGRRLDLPTLLQAYYPLRGWDAARGDAPSIPAIL
jgi:aldehyde:ferredoxin oxidoreductase